jgi:hypothetical protein
VIGSLIRRTLALVIAAGGAIALSPASAATAASPRPAVEATQHIAYQPFTDTNGWGAQRWDGDIAGATDPWNQQVQAWSFLATGAGQLCVETHLSNGFGWQNQRCGDSELFVVGAPYSGLDVDGLSWRTDTGWLCVDFQIIQNGSLFWSGPLCTGTQRFAAEWPGGRITAIAAWYA